MVVTGDRYRPGRRYYITPHGLVAGGEIKHDTSYVDVWKELIEVLNKYYNETPESQEGLKQQSYPYLTASPFLANIQNLKKG